MKRFEFTVHSSQFVRFLSPFACFLFTILLPTQLALHFWPEYTYLHGVRIDYLAPYISMFDLICIFIVMLNLFQHLMSIRSRTKFHNFGMTERVDAVSKIQSFVRNFLTHFPRNLIPVTVTIMLVIINTLFSFSPLVTLFRIAKIVLYFVAGYFVMKSLHDGQGISPPIRSAHGVEMTQKGTRFACFMYGIFASTMLVFILAVWQFVTKSSVGGLWYFLGEREITLSLPGIAKMAYDGKEFLRPYSTFSHPNSMGGFYLVLYFLIEWILSLKQSVFSDKTRGSIGRFPIESGMTSVRIILGVTQILAVFIIILSFSKVAIGAFVLLSFIKLIRDKDYRKCIFCFSARISIFLFLLFFTFFFSGDPYTLDKRLFLTSQSIDVIKNHWLTGTGVGTSLIAQSRLLGAAPGRFTDTLQPVHNIYLLFISEVGLIGVAILSLLIYLNRKMFEHWQKLPVMAISAILLTGLFDHYWLTLSQNTAIFIFVILATLSVLPSRDLNPDKQIQSLLSYR